MANEREKKAKSAKIDEAVDVLAQFGLPHAQLNDRTAYCLLALLNLTEGMPWSNATAPLVGITPMMDFARNNYAADYAPNTRETFRRFSMHQMVQAGIALYNPASGKRADFLQKACDILLETRSPDTPCGVARSVGRAGQTCRLLTLRALRDEKLDMLSIVFIGSSNTKIVGGRLVTPRGYEL